MGVMHSKLEFENGEEYLIPIVHEKMHRELGAKQDGYQFSPAYKRGYWDGIIDFYNKETNTFHTGLAPQVDFLLGTLQGEYAFEYRFIDERPESFMDVEELPNDIVLLDDAGEPTITLRDYQYDAVTNAISKQVGIIEIATNGGKCVVADTKVNTNRGILEIADIFNNVNEKLDSNERVIEYQGDIHLVNRYGKLEKPSHLTVNGVRAVKEITTYFGYKELITDNHPLLVLDTINNFVWVEAKDLHIGDIVVSRVGDLIFGSKSLDKNEAYNLGLDFQEAVNQKEIIAKITETDQVSQEYFFTGVKDKSNAYNLKCSTRGIAESVQLMLLNLGYRAHITEEASSYLLSMYNTKRSTATYGFTQITDIKDKGEYPTYDVCLPRTHSFMANGMINHNTEIAGGIIQQLIPRLERGERIAFFTNNTAIFTQSIERIETRLGIKVGVFGAGKKDFQQVTFVMIPTINSAMTSDPEKGLKLTAKEQLIKKIAKDISPRMIKGVNQRSFLKTLINNYPRKTKVDKKTILDLEDILYTCGSDREIILRFKGYIAEYQNIIEKKNKKVLDKYTEAKDFLESVAVMIVDEAHHSSADTWFKSLSDCVNAQYRIALTGSIDRRDPLLWQRMQALYNKEIIKVSNETLISLGHSAKPKITMFPIVTPNGEQESDFREAYDKCIVENEYRNKLITQLTTKFYSNNKGVLILVNRLEHGERLCELLSKNNVKHSFIHGELDNEFREEQLSLMREGKLKVLIATTIADEGVDISGIDMLILGAGGKSLRQTLQRVGRALRKKKQGENVATIIDFVDYTNKHLLKHSKERRKTYIEEKFDIQDIKN